MAYSSSGMLYNDQHGNTEKTAACKNVKYMILKEATRKIDAFPMVVYMQL